MPLTLKFQSAEEFAAIQAAKIKNPPVPLDIKNLSISDIKSILESVKRPFDHVEKRKFHFIAIEKNDVIFLFDGINKLVEVFEKETNETSLELIRRVRLFALNLFLNANSPIGGFIFDCK